MRNFQITHPMNFPFKITFLGDSKTADNGFQPTLLRNLAAVSDYYPLTVAPAQLATGGWKVADLDNALTAWLNAATDTPDLILLNIGVNDLRITSEASFKASFASVLDKPHVKWPNMKMLVTKVWKRSFDAEAETMNDIWMPEVITPRNTFADFGGDERIYLKGSNDGNSYTSDGIHPNLSGNGYMANAAVEAILFP